MELNRSTRTTRAPTPKTVPTHFFGTESHTGQKDLPFTHHPDDTRRVGTIVALWGHTVAHCGTDHIGTVVVLQTVGRSCGASQN